MKKKDKKAKATSDKGSGFSLSHMFFGDLISSSYFHRHKYTIILVMALMMLYITIKYECRTSLEAINNLKEDLTMVKSESIRERSTYRSRTKESTMTQLVDSMNLNLRIQDQPPTTLIYHE